MSMTRIVISLFAGIAFTVGALTIAALVWSHGDSGAIIPFSLYWSTIVTDKLGFGDCGNADSIADKVKCMRLGLIIDAISYPLVIIITSYIIHHNLFRREKRPPMLQPPNPEK
jgi:hypothetical protein